MTERSESWTASLRRPERAAKAAPCRHACPIGNDVRGWVAFIAQRDKLGISLDEACRRAWEVLAASNPFPATMGRVCPHPCETACNRAEKDGAVAVHSIERFLGDWAITAGVTLPRLSEGPHPESIGVVGAGPAGLSFAYQMARRGYRVTVYEKHGEAGGMLRHGIPTYRLPKHVLDAEIGRIVALGVDLQTRAGVGDALSLDALRVRHDALFIGIGAQSGRTLNIPGADAPGAVRDAIGFLAAFNRGERPPLGNAVVVVGGGNTAIDAARAARRLGARVTVVYRRTRDEIPAIAAEVEEALAEGVVFEFLSSPVAYRSATGGTGELIVRGNSLGEPDASGRRRPVPVEGTDRAIPVDTVLAAVSQDPDWSGLDGVERASVELDRIAVGGDARGIGIASRAIAAGRDAALAVHAKLRGLPPGEAASPGPEVSVRLDYYAPAPRTGEPSLPLGSRLFDPDAEVVGTISENAFLSETARCLSCGSCFACQHCMMYCNPGGYTRLTEPLPGAYFALAFDRCEGCGKCIEVCPCGFLGTAP